MVKVHPSVTYQIINCLMRNHRRLISGYWLHRVHFNSQVYHQYVVEYLIAVAKLFISLQITSFFHKQPQCDSTFPRNNIKL